MTYGEVPHPVLSKNPNALKIGQMTGGLLSIGRASFRLVGAILYVNNKVLTARFNGRTVESLILRNSLISKSDSFLTTHSRFVIVFMANL